MPDLEWKEPPPSRSSSTYDYQALADALRERPGEWAIIIKSAPDSQRAQGVSAGKIAAFRPARAFEGRSVKVADGAYDIYARYVGEADTATAPA